MINKDKNEFIFTNSHSCFWSFFDHNSFGILDKLNYIKLFIDLINKLMPTKRQTVVNVFLTNIFPFNFDR